MHDALRGKSCFRLDCGRERLAKTSAGKTLKRFRASKIVIQRSSKTFLSSESTGKVHYKTLCFDAIIFVKRYSPFKGITAKICASMAFCEFDEKM